MTLPDNEREIERATIRQRFDNIRRNVEEGMPEMLLQGIKELSDLCRAHFPRSEPGVRILIPHTRRILAEHRSEILAGEDFKAALNKIGKDVLEWIVNLEQQVPQSIVPVALSTAAQTGPPPPSPIELSPGAHVGRRYGAIYGRNVDADRTGVLIHARGLTKSLGSSFTLSAVDLTLKRGEILGVVGVNASGKTTLLRMLLGDILPDTGTIAYPAFEPPGTKRNWRAIKARMARVSQGTTPWPGEVLANLEFIASSYATQANNWTDDLDQKLARYELDQYKSYKWTEIAGGYRTRFDIVRALLSNPDILVLDEPLAYLDIITQQVVLEDLRAIAGHQEKPIGVIVTSQQLYEIEAIADRLIVLEGGKCKFSDTIAALQTSGKERIVELKIVGKSLREVEDHLKDFPIIGITPSEMGLMIRFPPKVALSEISKSLSSSCGNDFVYFRDVSKSCRRLFDLGEQEG